MVAKKRIPEEVDDIEAWNREDASELDHPNNRKKYSISVASRDWTVETIVQQIRSGNIDLDPAFQRRNAWRDPRRSRLIESFILGFPVPQIVLAESTRQRGKFIVIDGKQRLMTIAGFFLPDYRNYWTQSKLIGLEVLEDLNKIEIDDVLNKAEYAAERRQLANADIRTTIITVLYDIFYRINVGSVPLSSQELRQALLPGKFSRYLLEVTGTDNPLWTVLKINAPDPRLRDVELLLRLIAWRKFSSRYKGNMKSFLDDTMETLNDHWVVERDDTESLVGQILKGIGTTSKIFGENAGRKYKAGEFESSFNRALFEVQAYYFSFAATRLAATKNPKAVKVGFEKLSGDLGFIASIESTTKSIENARTRFVKFHGMLRKVLPTKLVPIRVGASKG